MSNQPKLKIKQINFGQIDAQIELEFGKETYFRDSFYMPEGLDLDTLKFGHVFYLQGLKGAGKTALLRYLSDQLHSDVCYTRFIVFKHDVSENEKIKLERMSRISLVDDKIDGGYEVDFEDAWMVYFHRYIARQIKESGEKKILSGKAAQKYIELADSVGFNSQESTINSIAEAASSGSVRVALNLGVLKVETGLNLDFSHISGSDIPVSLYNEIAMGLLEKSNKGSKRFVIFVDEVNLSFGSRKNFKRDCRLIRDLIIAIYRMNAFFEQKCVPIKIICALRNEVINTPWISGKEVNKYVSACGEDIQWHRPVNIDEQPLLHVIERKIIASEKQKLGRVVTTDQWESYFSSQGTSVKAFRKKILDMSWFSPRDIVILFQCMQKHNRNPEKFTVQGLRAASKEYARQMWNEKEEALLANFNAEEVDAIQKILKEIGPEMKFQRLEKLLEYTKKRKDNKNLERLLAERGLLNVLEDLYRLGVIGNQYKKNKTQINRWVYRGDDFDENEPFRLHASLMPKFFPGESA